MKKTEKKAFRFFAGIMLATPMVLHGDDVAFQEKATENTDIFVYKEVEPKILQNKMIKALKIVFDPVVTARTINTRDNAKKVLKKLEQLSEKIKLYSEQDQLKLVRVISGLVIKPVKGFFRDLYDYRNLLAPLVEESLVDGFEESIIYKFLHLEDKDQIDTFFTDYIRTPEELAEACQEFCQLFGDLERTMPDVFEKGQEFLKSNETILKAPRV